MTHEFNTGSPAKGVATRPAGGIQSRAPGKPGNLLTGEEAVKEFGFAPSLLRRWQELGRIAPYRVGGKFKFKRHDLLDMIQSAQTLTAPENSPEYRDPSLG
jgi:hypothetical protein